MVSKLAFLILSAAVAAAGLLVVRQQRLQAVHDMAQSVMRAHEDERALWRLRIEIANLITPGNVAVMAQPLGPMSPIPMLWCVAPAPPSIATVASADRDEPLEHPSPDRADAEPSSGALADEQWSPRRAEIAPDDAPASPSAERGSASRGRTGRASP